MNLEIVNNYIKSDCYRYVGKATKKDIIKLFFKNSTFRWQVAFRMCKGDKPIRYVGRILMLFNKSKIRLQIPTETIIGYGLYIGHGGPVVIHSSTVIGNNCNLSQFVTIGTNNGKAANIGDNVYIGPSVCVIEDVNIGNNVTIGAGSIVTKDIPDNATAVGNYAKIINLNNPGRYISNRWVIR